MPQRSQFSAGNHNLLGVSNSEETHLQEIMMTISSLSEEKLQLLFLFTVTEEAVNKLLSPYLISITLKTWSRVPVQICLYPILLPRGHCCCSLKLSGKT